MEQQYRRLYRNRIHFYIFTVPCMTVKLTYTAEEYSIEKAQLSKSSCALCVDHEFGHLMSKAKCAKCRKIVCSSHSQKRIRVKSDSSEKKAVCSACYEVLRARKEQKSGEYSISKTKSKPRIEFDTEDTIKDFYGTLENPSSVTSSERPTESTTSMASMDSKSSSRSVRRQTKRVQSSDRSQSKRELHNIQENEQLNTQLEEKERVLQDKIAKLNSAVEDIQGKLRRAKEKLALHREEYQNLERKVEQCENQNMVNRNTKVKTEEEEKAEAYLTRAKVCIQRQEHQKAKSYLKKSIRLVDASYEAWICLSQVFYACDELEEAYEACDMSISIQESAAGYTLLGNIANAMEDHDDAIDAFRQALELARD